MTSTPRSDASSETSSQNAGIAAAITQPLLRQCDAHRPGLVVVSYEKGPPLALIRDARQRLEAAGYRVVEAKFPELGADPVAAILERRSLKVPNIFFVHFPTFPPKDHDIHARAINALNLQRGVFFNECLCAVFWASRASMPLLSDHASNFLDFRLRFLEVEGEPTPALYAPVIPASTAAPAAPPAETSAAATTHTIHNLPFGRNKYFKGRKQILANLKKTLASGRPAALTQAVVGEGGVGKTAIALEFCRQNLGRYRLIWWIRAERSLATDFIALAEKLGIAVKGLDEDQVVAAVHETLSAAGGWLLVFDNAAGPEEVRKYLPTIPAGHVIITSRDQTWVHVIETVPVDVMKPKEAEDFLLARAGRAGPADRAEAAELAKALGYLPLALEQAGAYLAVRKQGFRYYLNLFEKKRSRLFTLNKALGYEDTVWATYNVSIQEAEDKTLAGAELIKLMAFLAPDDIPLEIVKLGAEFLPPDLADDLRDPIRFDQMVMVLSRYSLIKLEADLASIHRLLQDVVREKMSPDERKTWAQAAVKIVDHALPSDPEDPKEWPRYELLLDHALAAAEHAEKMNTALEQATRLLNEAGVYLSSKALYTRAEPLMRRALSIDEASFGPDHPNVARDLNNLATLLQATNRLSEAEPLMRRSLSIAEASFGPDHPKVAIRLNNLATLLQDTNRLSDAEPLMRRALSIAEASFGPDHPKVAIRLNNLATLLQDTNRLSDAEPLMRRSLSIAEASFGPDHPKVAIRLNNLAQLLQATNRLSEAEPLMRRALSIDEASFGPDHPKVAIRLNNLAQLFNATKRSSEAVPLMRRAIEINEASLGPDHPNVAIGLGNLAMIEAAKGRRDEAEELLTRALGIVRSSYHDDGHPHIQEALRRLKEVRAGAGDAKGMEEKER